MQAKKGDLPVIDFSKSHPKKEICLQDIADIEYIALETSDEVLMGNRRNLSHVSGKYILIHFPPSDLFMKEQLIAQFASAKPFVSMYHQFLNSMPPEKRGIFCKEVYGIALSEWEGLTQIYRTFLVRLIKSERQEFIDYVRNDTAIGQFLYASEELNLFLKMLNILEQPRINHKSSYTELSFSLLLSFDIDMKVKILSDKIRYAKADTYDFADLLEKSGEVG